MANYGVGGMSSAFQVLEISHTHFWTKVTFFQSWETKNFSAGAKVHNPPIKSITPKSIVRTCWRTWSMVLLRRARQQRLQDPEMFHHTAAVKTSTPPSIELQGRRPSKFPGARRRRRSPRGRRRVILILGGAEAPAKKILQVPRRPKCSAS